MKLNKYKIFRSLLLSFLCLGLIEEADAQFTLSAEVRPRAEFRNGFKTPRSTNDDAAFFVEQRSRIYLDYQEKKYKFRLSLQDIRLWGEVPQIFKQENGNTFLNEAWGQYYFTDNFSFKLGRQMISYDNQRFLGGLEWAQQGRRHDAVLLIYEKAASNVKFHAGFAFNSDDDIAEPALLQRENANFYSLGGNYKYLQYGWFNKKTDKWALSLLALNAGLQQPDSTVTNKQTFGIIPSVKLGAITLAGDFYYQTGKIGQNTVDAYLAGINATFKTSIAPITVGFEQISGKDDDDASTDITNFSPDYGTNHKFNGLMDYFFVGPANGSVGVRDFFIKSKFNLKKGTLVVNVHEFLTGSRQLNLETNEELSAPMATEVDLVYTIKPDPAVTFNVGYSHLFGTNTLLELRPGNKKSNNWAWLMITLKPTLLKIDKKN